jgi:hypothetical protein
MILKTIIQMVSTMLDGKPNLFPCEIVDEVVKERKDSYTNIWICF